MLCTYMRIAQIAPVIESVPPKKYGGTERVVSVLTEGLVARGHEVTLFASGDSTTSAKLSAVCDQALRQAGISDDRTRNGLSLMHIGHAYQHAHEFDIIHDHCGVFSMPTAQICATPVVQTMHGAFFNHNRALFRELNRPFTVTISQDQAKAADSLHSLGTIYNGLPLDSYPFSATQDGYLLYVGRITPLKGTHIAVRVAKAAGMPLVLAAKLEPKEEEFFAREVEPYLNDHIRWIGEVTESERNQLMSKAYAFMHPGLWREPFGLTLIEAMACGCPVIAFNRGSIPEIIEHGRSGFIVNSLNHMVRTLPDVKKLDRAYCRTYAIEHFGADRMVSEYEKLYQRILAGG